MLNSATHPYEIEDVRARFAETLRRCAMLAASSVKLDLLIGDPFAFARVVRSEAVPAPMSRDLPQQSAPLAARFYSLR